MSYPNYLIIHKKEWNRIRRKEEPTNKYTEREEYFKSLVEQSQEIIKKWNDSVEGHINKLEKQKQMKNAKDRQTIKEFHLKNQHKNNKDAIIKARELIFRDSVYGRQLLSALNESKTLEERDAQLEFKLELKNKSEDQKNIEPKATSLPLGNTEIEEQQIKLNKKQIDVEIAQINKAIFENKYKEGKKKRDIEKQQEAGNEMIEEILKKEIKLRTEILKREKQDIQKYKKQNEKIKKVRAEASQKEELIREVWRKYDDQIKCREKSVFNKIHRESCIDNRSGKAYKIIEQLNYEKEKIYNDFIETGIKQHVKRLNDQDQQEIESKTIELNKRKLLDKDNKLLMELKQQIDLLNDSNCRKQSLCVQGIPVNKEKTKTAERAAKPSFLAPHNKLLRDLKTRESDTSIKKGVSEEHAQFARHASDILRQCRYKNMARKVINDYTRINCIHETSLPISE